MWTKRILSHADCVAEFDSAEYEFDDFEPVLNDFEKEMDDDDDKELGDMLLTGYQFKYLFNNDSAKQNGSMKSFNLWPNGVVLIRIREDEFSKDFILTIYKAASDIMKVSCVRFAFDDKIAEDYVTITNGSHCSSNVGCLRNGEQFLKLTEWCKRANIIHTLLHTVRINYQDWIIHVI